MRDGLRPRPLFSLNHLKKELVLSPRLQAAAEFVRPGARLADVGTDHAYLPVYLSCQQRISEALASDIAKGPLKRAKETIGKYSAEEKVKTRLTPGLMGAEDFCPTDIVIAGMGGEMIVSVLENAGVVLDEGVHLILQPMTKQEVLRRFLSEKGFELLDETLVNEGERFYQILLCHYTGRAYSLSPLEEIFGPILLKKGGKTLEKLLEKKLMQWERAERGRTQGKEGVQLCGELPELIREKLKALREED